MLVKGDVVALEEGRISPADIEPFLRNTDDDGGGAITLRGSHVQNQSVLRGNKQLELCGNVQVFRVLKTPIESDIKAWLENPQCGREDVAEHIYRSEFLIMRVLKRVIIAVLVADVAANALRGAFRKDAYTWPTLLLLHPANVLLCLFPITIPGLKFLMEVLGTARLLALIEAQTQRQRKGAGSSGFSPKLDEEERQELRASTQSKRFWVGPRMLFASLRKVLRRRVQPSYDAASKLHIAEALKVPIGGTAINLVHLLGSVTSMCVLDEQTLLASHAAVEEIHALKDGQMPVVIDLCADAEAHFGLRFENPDWKTYLPSLKPAGLAISLGAVFQRHFTHRLPGADLARFVAARAQLPSGLHDLANELGFRSSDAANYSLCCAFAVTVPSKVLGPEASALLAKSRPGVDSVSGCARKDWRHGTEDAEMICVVVKKLSATADARKSIGGEFHLMSWGDPRLLADTCAEYWDGESICPLRVEAGKRGKKLIFDRHTEWTQLGFDTIAFAYTPIPAVFASRLTAMAKREGRGPHFFVVEDKAHSANKSKAVDGNSRALLCELTAQI